MLENGYVTLPRLFFRDWEWSDDANTVAVFVRLLIEADIVPNSWHGIPVPRGGMVSSYARLAEKTGLSVKKVRTAIKHLETAGCVAKTAYPNCTVFAIKNFDLFQAGASLRSNEGQTMDKPTASNGQQNKKIEEQEEKEERNLSILDATSKKIPTLIEIQTFAEQEGLCVDVQKFYDYYTETGWMTKNQQPITNWKSTLLYWNQSEGTPHKKTKQEEPRSENADIYESLIGRVIL